VKTLLAAAIVALIVVPMASALAVGDSPLGATPEHVVGDHPTKSTTVERTTTSTTRPAIASTSTPETTTTTEPATTTSTSTLSVGPTTPPDSGLRGAATGLLADYDGDLMIGLDMTEVDSLGIGITSDFSMAVEALRAAALWIAVLALMLVAAVLKGVDRHQSRQTIR
jgi:hypothetical protein